MIKIPKAIRHKIATLAGQEPNLETCGYLAGKDNEVKEIYPMRNLDRSSEHFRFDPEEQFAALDRARKEDMDLIAVFHSHPATPARMSEEDILWANDPGIFYLIYSLATEELRAFRVDDEKLVKEVPVVLIP
ncbi:MAG: M67 family metallopeptidase [Spirochaetota bacterium]